MVIRGKNGESTHGYNGHKGNNNNKSICNRARDAFHPPPAAQSWPPLQLTSSQGVLLGFGQKPGDVDRYIHTHTHTYIQSYVHSHSHTHKQTPRGSQFFKTFTHRRRICCWMVSTFCCCCCCWVKSNWNMAKTQSKATPKAEIPRVLFSLPDLRCFLCSFMRNFQ